MFCHTLSLPHLGQLSTHAYDVYTSFKGSTMLDQPMDTAQSPLKFLIKKYCGLIYGG